jgi:hypothetical protein
MNDLHSSFQPSLLHYYSPNPLVAKIIAMEHYHLTTTRVASPSFSSLTNKKDVIIANHLKKYPRYTTPKNYNSNFMGLFPPKNEYAIFSRGSDEKRQPFVEVKLHDEDHLDNDDEETKENKQQQEPEYLLYDSANNNSGNKNNSMDQLNLLV